MREIKQECVARGITRLCHFTQSRNLAHVFDSPYGLLSRRTLRIQDMPHNPTDLNRYDGRDDLICCSVEYPNVYYFAKVQESDRLFRDWVVLLVDPRYLWHPETRFCACNAARERGRYIIRGIQGFRSLYETTSPGINFTRSSSHLPASPTDIQAEVLIKDPIPLQSITGIVVKTELQAQLEILRLNLQDISIDTKIYIVPEFFDRRTLPRLIRLGKRKAERLYKDGGHYG